MRQLKTLDKSTLKEIILIEKKNVLLKKSPTNQNKEIQIVLKVDHKETCVIGSSNLKNLYIFAPSDAIIKHRSNTALMPITYLCPVHASVSDTRSQHDSTFYPSHLSVRQHQ